MKTKNYFIAVAGAFVLSFFMMSPLDASENLEVSAIEASKKIRMELETPANAEIEVNIFNNFNRVLYSDRISAGTTFETEFDFSTLKEGTYRLVSELGNIRYNRVLEVNDRGIEFKDSYYTYVPFFIQEGELMKVQFKNSLENSVRIQFEDSWGEIFEVYYQEPGISFGAMFSLQELPRGSYLIRLITGRDSFTQEFEMN